MKIAIRSENKGHVADAFAMRHGLRVQSDMDGRRVIVML